MSDEKYLARLQQEALLMRNAGMQSSAGMANCMNQNMLMCGANQDDYLAWLNRRREKATQNVRLREDVQ